MGVEKRFTLVYKKTLFDGLNTDSCAQLNSILSTSLYCANISSVRSVASLPISKAILIFSKHGMDFVPYGDRFWRNSGIERVSDLLFDKRVVGSRHSSTKREVYLKIRYQWSSRMNC